MCICFFFFKQKTAYEMRISDWSSDVCSSDLQENIFIVGDPSQSIYGFRGSAPSTMTEFCKRFQRAKIIALETNYRSSQEIVTVINAIDRKMKTGFERTLHSDRGHRGIKDRKSTRLNSSH